MTITDNLIPVNKYNCPGTASKPARICIHCARKVGIINVC